MRRRPCHEQAGAEEHLHDAHRAHAVLVAARAAAKGLGLPQSELSGQEMPSPETTVSAGARACAACACKKMESFKWREVSGKL
jgi:hypothetical protein